MFYELHHIATADFFKKQYGQNFSWPPHMHQCFELITAISGEMTVTVDEAEYHIRKGDALLIFPNQIHSLSSVDCEHLLCIFSPKLVAAFSSRVAAKKPINSKFVPAEPLLNILKGLDDHAQSIAQKGILYLLCDSFDKTAEYVSRENDSKNLLEKIFLFVEESFRSDCTLHMLSKSLGYDYSYLSRYFKRNVGISFNQYVNIYRLNNARYLLNNTNETVLHCAMESGYRSLRSFNRNFKLHFKASPQEYIKASRE